MKKLLTYAHLQLKRMMRFAPFVFLITLVLCLCLGLAFQTLMRIDGSEEDQQKLSVGVVGDFSNGYLSFGITAIQSLDASRFSIDLVELTEAEARAKLEAGELTAYVIIPDGFMEAAFYGEVNPITYVTTSSGIDIATLFKDEILDVISCMLVESQNGIYGLQDIIVDTKIDLANKMDHSDALTAEYVTMILNRSFALDVQTIGVSDSLSFGGYMFSGLVVLMLLLCGMTCCPLFVRRDMALPKLMNANRQYPPAQIAGEYAAYFVMILFNMALLLLLVLLGAKDATSLIPELDGIAIGGMVVLFLRFIPAILAITALQFLLYELSSSIVSGVLLQFICAIGLAYVSGCLYPISFFPESIRALSEFTPSGIARGYLSSLILGDSSSLQLLALICYTTVLLGASVLVRHRRIQTT